MSAGLQLAHPGGASLTTSRSTRDRREPSAAAQGLQHVEPLSAKDGPVHVRPAGGLIPYGPEPGLRLAAGGENQAGTARPRESHVVLRGPGRTPQ